MVLDRAGGGEIKNNWKHVANTECAKIAAYMHLGVVYHNFEMTKNKNATIKHTAGESNGNKLIR